MKKPTHFIYGKKDTAVLPTTVCDVADFVDAPYNELRVPDSAHWVQ